MRRRNLLISLTAVAIVVVGGVSATFGKMHSSQPPVIIPEFDMANTPQVARVVAIGGSVAHGWDDKNHGGYLARAFKALSATSNTTYSLINKSIIGANAVQLQKTLYKGRYSHWLDQYNPNIVVISWGLLNDCLPNTPMAEFDKYVTKEINEALAQKSVVYVVSPPVTEASYTKYKEKEQAYVDAEKNIVNKVNNPNVYFFDVYDEMKQYLKQNNQSVKELGKNAWHPNSMGHALAADLLIHDIRSITGGRAPSFQ